MSNVTKIVAFSGSLREASYNTAAINAAKELAPPDCEIALVDISELPLYSQDIDGANTPSAVVEIAHKVMAADAILFATPEYNYSVPGVLKNAIDWLSRQKPIPFAGKPTAIMSASMSFLGGVRAHYHLRQVLVYLDMHLLNKPEIMIGSAHEKFDSQGRLTDPTTRELVAQMMAALTAWSQKLS